HVNRGSTTRQFLVVVALPSVSPFAERKATNGTTTRFFLAFIAGAGSSIYIAFLTPPAGSDTSGIPPTSWSATMVFGPLFCTWFPRKPARRPRPARSRKFRTLMPAFDYLEDRCVPTSGAPTGIAVFQPNTAAWYLHHNPGPGAPDSAPFAYGGNNWIPVAGDWDGNGTTTLGVFDQSTAPRH